MRWPPGEIAAVLTEPALTNIGIVLPDDGLPRRPAALCDETGTLLMIDETHTLSAGPGGRTAAWGLDPDIVTMGKAIAGGIPIGAFGLRDRAGRARARPGRSTTGADIVDVGGIGGTLAGNALSMAAARATLGEVLTDEAFARMEACAHRLTDRAEATIARHGMPWTMTRLGARAEYRFCSPAPRNGTSRLPPTTPSSTSTCTSPCQPGRARSPRSTTWSLMCPRDHRRRRRPPRRALRGRRLGAGGLRACHA